MSFKFNIAANYASQFYVAILGILVVPVYLALMGPEGFGLVGFFTLLQAWFQLFDFGLTATMSRETARYLGGAYDAAGLRRLLRSLEGAFWAVGLLAALALAIAAPALSSGWLGVVVLSDRAVETSLALMAFTLALRWISGLYRGVALGLERQVWLGVFNSAMATLRFAGVIPLLYVFADSQLVAFFTFQLVISCIELVVLAGYCYARTPVPTGTRIGWSASPLRSVWKFSATVAFTSVVWVLVTQTDRLILSKVLSLQMYGFFTAAVLLASAVTLVGIPITQALLPRLTRLAEEGDDAGMLRLYRQATQAVTAIAGSAAIVMAMLAEKVLWIWTGNADFAADFARVLALYAIGNGFLALAAFPYYLQYARGDLRLHFWGNIFFMIVLIPAIVFMTTRFGVTGAAAVWAITNAVFFLFWTPVVHRRFAPGLHGRWLGIDVARVLLLPMLLGVLMWFSHDWEMSRIAWGSFVLAAAGATTIAALSGCGLLKAQLNLLLGRLLPRAS